jgi:hypothetical protein
MLGLPSTMLGLKPVEFVSVGRSVPRGLLQAVEVGEVERSEKPIQQFIEKHPVALVSLVIAHRVWVFPRQMLGKSLGGGWVPDFLLCDWNSMGPQWTIVELESPTVCPINRSGISAALRHAQMQISDYRRHMAENWKDLERVGMPRTKQLLKSWIIVGRRTQHSEDNQARLADFREDKIEVASYDRLLERCIDMADFRTRDRRAARMWLKGPGAKTVAP